MFLTLPDIAVSQASQLSSELEVSETRFGNGYISRRNNSIKGPDRRWRLVFSLLDSAAYDQLDAFFIRHDGTIPFYWQAPGLLSSQLYVCQKWQAIAVSASHSEMKAEFLRY